MKTSRPEESAPPAKSQMQQKNELQRLSILEAAGQLFIERGYGGTNVNDIAEAMGVTRTAVYYYFKSKEAILEALAGEVALREGALAKPEPGASELPVEERLRQVVLRHATQTLSNSVCIRVVERNESILPEPTRRAVQQARRQALGSVIQIIEDGLAAGALEVPDARVASLAIIGMCNWSVWWFDPSEMTVESVAHSIAELAVRAVIKTGRRSARAASAAECIRRIRENLDALEE